jgi:uncharacterized protein involved in cysteine biosynthesis
MIKRFFLGFLFIFSAFSVLRRHTELLKWLLMPFIFDILLLISGGVYGAQFVPFLSEKSHAYLMSLGLNSGGHFLYYLLMFIIWFVLFIAISFLIYLLGSIIASPFYAVMAKVVLIKEQALIEKKFILMDEIKLAIKMLATSVLRVIMITAVGVALFAVSFLPLVGLLVGFCFFILIIFDVSDYALESLGFTLKQRVVFVKSNWPEFLGMSFFLSLTSFMPGLLIILAPFSVIGSAYIISKIVNRGVPV